MFLLIIRSPQILPSSPAPVHFPIFPSSLNTNTPCCIHSVWESYEMVDISLRGTNRNKIEKGHFLYSYFTKSRKVLVCLIPTLLLLIDCCSVHERVNGVQSTVRDKLVLVSVTLFLFRYICFFKF
jgi:hypothetical protein